MEFVIEIALSFPVVVFSMLMPVVLLYWVLVALVSPSSSRPSALPAGGAC